MPIVYPTVALSEGADDYPVLADMDAAQSYLLADPNAAIWRAASDDDRARWLIAASRILSRQAIEPPLTSLSEIPLALAQAAIELASAIANGFDAANRETTSDGIKRQKAGSVEIEYFASAATGGLRFPLPVWELLKGLLSAPRLAIGGSLATGVDGINHFPDTGYLDGYRDRRAWD